MAQPAAVADWSKPELVWPAYPNQAETLERNEDAEDFRDVSRDFEIHVVLSVSRRDKWWLLTAVLAALDRGSLLMPADKICHGCIKAKKNTSGEQKTE